MIDKSIFLKEYEAVLTDVNGQQLVTEFNANIKIAIINRWHIVIARIESYNLVFAIEFDNNKVSVLQSEKHEDRLKKLGFISLTVWLKQKFKSMLELTLWKFVMLNVLKLKGYINSKRNIGGSSK